MMDLARLPVKRRTPKSNFIYLRYLAYLLELQRIFVIFISTPGMMDLARLPVKRRTAKSKLQIFF